MPNIPPIIPTIEILFLIYHILNQSKINSIVKMDIKKSLSSTLEKIIEFSIIRSIRKNREYLWVHALPHYWLIFSGLIYVYFCYRYVNDILAYFKGTKRQLNTFLYFLNRLHLNISFTFKIENYFTIHCLDLTLTKIKSHSAYLENQYLQNCPNSSSTPHSHKLPP